MSTKLVPAVKLTREAVEVACPDCGQVPGQWCADGEQLHEARISLAYRAGVWAPKKQVPGSVFN
jgi:hypothetical protein